MIVKERSIPARIFSLEVLSERLLISHPKVPLIQQDLMKVSAGYKGEKAVSYYLDFLPPNDTFIFHSPRLPSGKHYFQIDYLILTQRFALILECKNFYGTLYFDQSFNQLIRTANDKEEGFQDPISQAKWQQQQLRQWLYNNNIQLPIEFFVVISNPSTILKTNPQNQHALKKVIHGHSLLEKIEEVNQRYKIEHLDMTRIRKLNKQLLKSHTPDSFNALDRYGIRPEEIITGVRCPNCGHLPMMRAKRTWLCPKCGAKDRQAHVKALQDYFYLMGSSITNKQFRDFVHLESEDTAQKMLKTLNLSHSGEYKARIYHKPDRDLL
ncbi:NERD domain-containing protein [Cytobacillus gottheilii]|uniref:NERD domain-containing protein n=1 Tax=Cytobacillus gottheilii TaxID=859144 RepID=UPI0009BBE6B3|nr:NERD domain-containing protein [Cytobacillus gottheilii]